MSINRDRPPTFLGRERTIRPRSPAEALEPTRAPSRPGGARSRREGRPIRGTIRFISGILTGALMVMAAIGGTIFLLNFQYNTAGPLTDTRSVTIRSGEGRLAIAEKLQKNGVIGSRQLFVANHFARNTARWLAGKSWRDLKAGEYQFKAGASMRAVLEAVARGRTVAYKVTIPEGFTSQQIVKRVQDMAELAGDIAQVPAEGSLLPDTYRFSKGSAREDIIKRMAAEQQRLVAKLWEGRAADLPIATMEEAIILASIVEKETGQSSERKRVASVFVNRLRKGMRLQSDPTIIYGIVGGGGSLGRPIYRSDIKKKTPYNTYTINGLPPGPICNPGRLAIEAVLQPAVTDDLYFVADGTGGHKFSATLKEHNEAVANWRVIEKAARAKALAAARAKKAAGGAEGGVGAAGVSTGPKADSTGGGAGSGATATNVAAASGAGEVPVGARDDAQTTPVSDAGGAFDAGSAIPLPVRKPR